MLPAQIRRAQPGFTLVQDRDDLLFCVSFAFRSYSPSPVDTHILGWHQFLGLGHKERDAHRAPSACPALPGTDVEKAMWVQVQTSFRVGNQRCYSSIALAGGTLCRLHEGSFISRAIISALYIPLLKNNSKLRLNTLGLDSLAASVVCTCAANTRQGR